MTNLFRPALLSAASLALLAAPTLAQDEEQADEEQTEKTKGEKELAKLLEGRVAGEPTSCIRTPPNDRVRVIDDTAIVYGRGKTIYVNRTSRPRDIDDHDTMVVRRFSGSQLCKTDIVTTIDRGSQMFSGVIFLSEFVPYTRVETNAPAEGS
ncbi:MAG: hypothetical protein HKP43_05895 [Altererythrobacter sp.]|nr:hypothetical protein [Altererythrobacter sp.]NNE49024.1 hypothetical protein [Altererythrobacter sp.]NNF95248.1 hypothetical protein [Altererythrobacter sp.]NNK46140.1 hypothetical protein [Altererythrobacter sp.]